MSTTYPKRGFVDLVRLDPGLEASEGLPGKLWGQSQRFTPFSSCVVEVNHRTSLSQFHHL